MTEPIKLPSGLLTVTLVREGVNKHRARDIEQWMNEKMALAVESATGALQAEVESLRDENDEDQSVIAIWRGRTQRAEAERDEARAEALEQARLNGMGSEREARLIAQVQEARAELARLTTLPSPPLWGKGCPVCGLGAGGKVTGLVCVRGDCPTNAICGVTK
jgi:hypothetical protein